MPSVGGLDWHNLQGSQLLESVWQLINSPQSHNTRHEMHPHGLTVSEKATCKSRLSHLVSNTCVTGQCMNVRNLQVEGKMNFSICDHKAGFPKRQSHMYVLTYAKLRGSHSYNTCRTIIKIFDHEMYTSYIATLACILQVLYS